MKKSLCLVLVLLCTVCLEALNNVMPEERELLHASLDCPAGNTSSVFFNVQTEIRAIYSTCNAKWLGRIGDMIDDILAEVGIGGTGIVELENTYFLAGVCREPDEIVLATVKVTDETVLSTVQEPDEITLSMLGSGRKLWATGFIWFGGGVSSNCDGNPCSIFVRSILTQISTTGLHWL